MIKNVPNPVVNILEAIGDKVLTFSNKDLVYKDSSGESYGRYEIDWAIDHNLVIKTFSKSRLVWEFKKR